LLNAHKFSLVLKVHF